MQVSISVLISGCNTALGYVRNLIKSFNARVSSYPNSIFEAEACLSASLKQLKTIGLLDDASLVITPNAYSEGVLYDIVPNTTLGDMSVVRATTGTRVNSSGLVEVVPYNTYTYSEQFDNSSWIKTNCTIEPNSIISPSGTLTADKVISTAIGSPNVQKDINSAETINHVVSIFAKKGTSDILELYSGPIGSIGVFNLTTGTIVSGSNTTITSFGDGWYRCTALVPSFVTYAAQYFIIKNATIGSYLYLWGVQAEKGSVPNKYFPTTTRLNIPRLDYTNSTCPTLLVEPQSTNLITYSEQFDDTSWFKNSISINLNSVTSPSGTLSADTFQNNGTSNAFLIKKNIALSAGTYSQSFYFKKNNNDWVAIYTSDNGLNYAIAWFDINIGVVGTVSAIGNFSSASSSIINMGNGWYRCILTFTKPITTFSDTSALTPNANNSLSSVIGQNSYIWGAQLETLAYPTSYIPTTSSTVTRNTDVISKTGISSLIGQAEGTLFVDFYPSSYTDVLNLSADGVFQTDIGIFYSTSASLLYVYFFISPTYVLQYSGAHPSNIKTKVAFAYKSGDLAIYINGVQKATYTNAFSIVSALNRIRYNQTNFAATGLVKYNQVTLFKTRLLNTELTQLTTL